MNTSDDIATERIISLKGGGGDGETRGRQEGRNKGEGRGMKTLVLYIKIFLVVQVVQVVHAYPQEKLSLPGKNQGKIRVISRLFSG